MCETAVEYAPDYQSFWTVSRKDNIVLCVYACARTCVHNSLNIDMQLHRSYALLSYRYNNLTFGVQLPQNHFFGSRLIQTKQEENNLAKM